MRLKNTTLYKTWNKRGITRQILGGFFAILITISTVLMIVIFVIYQSSNYSHTEEFQTIALGISFAVWFVGCMGFSIVSNDSNFNSQDSINNTPVEE